MALSYHFLLSEQAWCVGDEWEGGMRAVLLVYWYDMKITLITIGSPHLVFAKQGIDEYLKRINRFADVTPGACKREIKKQLKKYSTCVKKRIVS
jgi:hypothetical protein